MKFIATLAAGLLLLAGSTVGQQQPEQKSTERTKQNRSLDGTPLDPFKEAARIREKEAAAKNFKELKESAAELADLSQKLNQDVVEGGEDVISARIVDRADRIEKLARRIKDKAKAN